MDDLALANIECCVLLRPLGANLILSHIEPRCKDKVGLVQEVAIAEGMWQGLTQSFRFANKPDKGI
jgi:hypothetical protein